MYMYMACKVVQDIDSCLLIYTMEYVMGVSV